MCRFKKGDIIEAIAPGVGLSRAYILGVFTGKYGKYKGKKLYQLKIMNGTATVPVSAEVNYKLVKK